MSAIENCLRCLDRMDRARARWSRSWLESLLPKAAQSQSTDEILRGCRGGDRPRLVGYVAQDSAVRFPLTAMELVLQGRFAQGRLIGFESERDVSEAEWAMEATETSEFAARPLDELSGGERQRVMLARALAVRPGVLVLDEPVANLDISHQVKMLDLVRRLTDETGMSAIVVTHEVNLAAEFATSALLLKSGEMLAVGNPNDVITESLLERLFETRLMVDTNPKSGSPRVTLVTNRSQHQTLD